MGQGSCFLTGRQTALRLLVCILTVVLSSGDTETSVWKGFRLTASTYTDHYYDDACQTEFGPLYALADWITDIKPRIAAVAVVDASAHIGISSYPDARFCSLYSETFEYPGSAAWVKHRNETKESGSVNRFVFQRQDHGLPNCWLAFLVLGTHGNWTLSSGVRLNLPALCVARDVDNSAPQAVAGYAALGNVKCAGTAVYDGSLNGVTQSYTSPMGLQSAPECAVTCGSAVNCTAFNLDMAGTCWLLIQTHPAFVDRPGFACYVPCPSARYSDKCNGGTTVAPAGAAPAPAPSSSSSSSSSLFFARAPEFGFSRFMRIYTSDPDDEDDDANAGVFFARTVAVTFSRYFARTFVRFFKLETGYPTPRPTPYPTPSNDSVAATAAPTPAGTASAAAAAAAESERARLAAIAAAQAAMDAFEAARGAAANSTGALAYLEALRLAEAAAAAATLAAEEAAFQKAEADKRAQAALEEKQRLAALAALATPAPEEDSLPISVGALVGIVGGALVAGLAWRCLVGICKQETDPEQLEKKRKREERLDGIRQKRMAHDKAELVAAGLTSVAVDVRKLPAAAAAGASTAAVAVAPSTPPAGNWVEPRAGQITEI
jgi:hypothetical protein